MLTTLNLAFAATPFGSLVANSVAAVGALTPLDRALALGELAIGILGLVAVRVLSRSPEPRPAARAKSREAGYRAAA